jgi:Mce-associated membrane protein
MAFLRAPAARRPWVVAAVLAVVAVVLAVLLVAVVYPARNDHNDANDPNNVKAFNSTEQAAISAATTQTINLLTYNRKSFDADFTRAVNGTTGQLKSDLQKDKANTLSQLNANKFDLKAQITDSALESGDAKKGYLVLLVANGFRVDDKGTTSAAIPQRIQLTMTLVNGKWLASDLQGIDLS